MLFRTYIHSQEIQAKHIETYSHTHKLFTSALVAKSHYLVIQVDHKLKPHDYRPVWPCSTQVDSKLMAH